MSQIAEPTRQHIELCLLGGYELRGAGPTGAAVLSQSKPLALLAFLALSPDGRFQRRDRNCRQGAASTQRGVGHMENLQG